MKKFKHKFYIVFIICLLFLSACSKDTDELKSYKENMETFFTNVSDLNEKINAIDSSSDDSTTTLLSYLDEMNTLFTDMSNLDVPEYFEAVKDVSKDAADYMNIANSYYHKAYDGEFDEDALSLANDNYEMANKRLKTIISVLHGENDSSIDDSSTNVSVMNE